MTDGNVQVGFSLNNLIRFHTCCFYTINASCINSSARTADLLILFLISELSLGYITTHGFFFKRISIFFFQGIITQNMLTLIFLLFYTILKRLKQIALYTGYGT